MYVGIIMLFT